MPVSTRTRPLVIPCKSVDELLSLLLGADRVYRRDGLSVLEHSLQVADVLRYAFPDDFELQVAGLLHDIDHMVGCHPSQHGSVSADYLRRLFDEPLCELIRMHVPAKRYLIAIDSDYATRLSPESIAAMEHQGSGMTVEEQIVFENSSMARRVVALRRADEQATSPGVRTLPLAFWTDTIRALIKSPPLAVVRSIH